MVNVFPASEVVYCGSARDAGPRTTWPAVLNSDPWHGHRKFGAAQPVIVQVSCVHVELNAVNVSAPVRAMSTETLLAVAMAAEPTATESTATVNTLPFTVPVSTGRFE